jgi:serine/threonine protein kinase HipA of HipAB toxin-antitoxin module
MRDLAVAALGNRYRELAERSKRRQLTGAERTELDRLEVVIDTLRSMGSASG